jgi:hypothetical protein
MKLRSSPNNLSPETFRKVGSLALQWLNDFTECINQRDYERAELLFDQKVISFGTVGRRMMGLKELREQQWEKRWPLNQNFKFGDVSLLVGAPYLIIAVSWECKELDGRERQGRATIVLLPFLDKLICRHTHFSENPPIRSWEDGMWWCTVHNREATYKDANGYHRCDPKLGGIMLTCSTTFKQKGT